MNDTELRGEGGGGMKTPEQIAAMVEAEKAKDQARKASETYRSADPALAAQRAKATAAARAQVALDAVGVTQKDVDELRAKARAFLRAGDFRALEEDIQETTLLVMMIDGLIGTEPWRVAAAGNKAAAISLEARQRYVKTASTLLADLRGSQSRRKPMLEGVVDAERVE